MKRFLLVAIGVAGLAAPGVVWAQVGGKNVTDEAKKGTSVSASVRQDLKANVGTKSGETLRQRIEARLEAVKERQAEVKEKIAEVRKERVREFLKKMKKRLAAAIARQERLGNRIEIRLNKLAEAGEDVSEERKLLEQGRTTLAEAKKLVEELDAGVEAVFESNQPKEAFAQVRDQVKEIVDKLKEVHGLYVTIITQIKGLRVGASEEVTPVPTGVTPTVATPTPTVTE